MEKSQPLKFKEIIRFMREPMFLVAINTKDKFFVFSLDEEIVIIFRSDQ